MTLSAASGRTATVNYATIGNTAVSGTDFNAASGTLTFSGQLTRTITVQVKGDVLDESDEQFFVDLSGATNAGIADSRGVGTIVDNDPRPNFSIGDVSVSEGNSGTVNANFTVRLSEPSGRTARVNYETEADTALSGVDTLYRRTARSYSLRDKRPRRLPFR